MELARLKDIIRRAATWLGYTLKEEQEQAVQAKQSELGYSVLHLPHCQTMDNIVQELTTIMQ